MYRLCSIASISIALAGCMADTRHHAGTTPPGPGAPGAPGNPTEVPGQGSVDHHGTPGSPTGPYATARDTVRMSLRQFNNSIATIFGAPWTMSDSGGNRMAYSDFSYALGAPDYYTRLSEDLTPQMLFARGVEEGAIAVCGDALASDSSKPASQRAVMRKIDDPTQATSAQIDANLADMKLRFHGIDASLDPSRIAPYRQLYDRVAALDTTGAGPAGGWYAVCVAMVTDDAFVIF
jgi:hypothetical protein